MAGQPWHKPLACMQNLPHPSPFAAVATLAIPDSGLSLMFRSDACCTVCIAVSCPRHRARSTSLTVEVYVKGSRTSDPFAYRNSTLHAMDHRNIPLTSPYIFFSLLNRACSRQAAPISLGPPSNHAAAACKVSLPLRFALPAVKLYLPH